mgnify:CR=1 FL=1
MNWKYLNEKRLIEFYVQLKRLHLIIMIQNVKSEQNDNEKIKKNVRIENILF